MKYKRIVSCLLAAALTAGLYLSSPTAVFAADSGYQEHREAPEQFAPEIHWTETSISCPSGPNTLAGTLTMPKDAGETVPVAILLHGLSTDSRWCIGMAWYLADHGIASIRFDFAGSGLSTGAQEDMTVGSEVANTLDILDYVESQPYTDLDNIFLVGKSMGGVDAVLAAQQRQDEIRAMCLWYPGFGVGDAVRHGFLLGQFFDAADPPETVTAAGYTYGRDFLLEAGKLDCTAACRSYDGPVLILHGDLDFIAPIGFSFQMSEEFSDCALHVVPGGYHGFWGFQELHALEDMTVFLQEHMA